MPYYKAKLVKDGNEGQMIWNPMFLDIYGASQEDAIALCNRTKFHLEDPELLP